MREVQWESAVRGAWRGAPECSVFCQISVLMNSESLPGSCNHKCNSKQTNTNNNERKKKDLVPSKHIWFPFSSKDWRRARRAVLGLNRLFK